MSIESWGASIQLDANLSCWVWTSFQNYFVGAPIIPPA